MAMARPIPEHLLPLSAVLGAEVDVTTLEKLHAVSKGDVTAAINHYFEGTYHNATIPQQPQPRHVPQATRTYPSSIIQRKPEPLNNQIDLTLDDLEDTGAGSSSSTNLGKRKVKDSFFPKYLGEITIIAYAVGGMVKIQAGDQVRFERSRPNPQLQIGRKKGLSSGSASTGWGGKASKENNVVRFTTMAGFEIGRLQVDTSRWVAKILDYGLAEFDGTIILAPPILKTGAEIVLTMRCHLNASAFTTPNSDSSVFNKKSSAKMTMSSDRLETVAELDLKYRKFAVNTLFRELALTPVATNSPAGPRDVNIELFSSTPEGSSSQQNGDNEDDEEKEPEVSDKELDVLYEKAQQHGREFEPMDTPNTMTYTLKPYQRTALSWMYYKECAQKNDEHQTLHPLWEEYEFKQEDGHQDLRSDAPKRYYFNPYSSELSLEFPTSDQLCRGGILADEMGLGKTIETLSLVHANRFDRSILDSPEQAFSRLSTSNSAAPRRLSPTTLIICPMSLLSQWRDEAINSSDGSLKVEVYYGASKQWTDDRLVQRDAPDVMVTSYGTVMSEYAGLIGGLDTDKATDLDDVLAQNKWKKGSALFNVEFHRVVLDEAHQIKGRNTKTAKACYAIDATRRWVLTGTPIQNKLEDLFSLVHFLRSEPWSNFSFWRTFITIPFESKDKDKAMKVVTSVLEPLVLRRTKTTKDEFGNPIVQLPEKIVDIEYLEFSEPENDIYQALFKDGKTKFNHYCRAGTVLRHYASIFQLLMRMRQVCDHPILVVGGNKGESAETLKDGPIQLDELLAKFTGDSDEHGASFGASVLESLKTGAVAECPVCLEDMDGGVLLPCMHAACRGCVTDFLQAQDDAGKRGECPICRHGPITEDDLIEYVTSEAKPKNEPSDVVAGNILGGGSSSSSERVVQIRRNNFKSSSKLDALMRHLNKVRKVEPRTKSVIFSQFTGMMDLTEGVLERDGFEFLRLDGSHSQASREKTLEAFKDPSHPALVILISLRAGGVGLNLTAANRVYMLDPWWNFAVESQAIDRVHRIGQTKPVIVKRFIIQGSVEEKILAIQSRKNALASGLGMTKAESQGARMEDLQEIFS